MALVLTKPWAALDAETVERLPGQLGVYELADDDDATVGFGFAGARALFGLRGELLAHASAPPFGATQFRVEVNQQYQTRFRELLMVYQAQHGRLPPLNASRPPVNLGRLSPL